MNKLIIALAAAALALLPSCSKDTTQLSYFTNIDELETPATGNFNIKIEPGDELFINVTSTAPEAAALYNLPVINPSRTSSTGDKALSSGMYLTYTVDSEGYIQYPVLGRLHVAGLTLDELQKDLTRRISVDVKDPVVSVEMMNFYVDVAGEVVRPGRYSVRERRFSVLDALSTAGDLTQYGERTNVLVIREENGKRVHARLDLNDASVLASPYFFLKQNDYVYVEPNKIRKENSKYNSNNAFKLQVISTVVSGASVIVSLVIALAVK